MDLLAQSQSLYRQLRMGSYHTMPTCVRTKVPAWVRSEVTIESVIVYSSTINEKILVSGETPIPEVISRSSYVMIPHESIPMTDG